MENSRQIHIQKICPKLTQTHSFDIISTRKRSMRTRAKKGLFRKATIKHTHEQKRRTLLRGQQILIIPFESRSQRQQKPLLGLRHECRIVSSSPTLAIVVSIFGHENFAIDTRSYLNSIVLARWGLYNRFGFCFGTAACVFCICTLSR